MVPNQGIKGWNRWAFLDILQKLLQNPPSSTTQAKYPSPGLEQNGLSLKEYTVGQRVSRSWGQFLSDGLLFELRMPVSDCTNSSIYERKWGWGRSDQRRLCFVSLSDLCSDHFPAEMLLNLFLRISWLILNASRDCPSFLSLRLLDFPLSCQYEQVLC